MPLAATERALLDERRRLTRDEALAVARLPLDELPALIALAHRHAVGLVHRPSGENLARRRSRSS